MEWTPENPYNLYLECIYGAGYAARRHVLTPGDNDTGGHDMGMRSTSHAAVKDGVVQKKGSAKDMRRHVKQQGGEKAGWQFFLTMKAVGERVAPPPDADPAEWYAADGTS